MFWQLQSRKSRNKHQDLVVCLRSSCFVGRCGASADMDGVDGEVATSRHLACLRHQSRQRSVRTQCSIAVSFMHGVNRSEQGNLTSSNGTVLFCHRDQPSAKQSSADCQVMLTSAARDAADTWRRNQNDLHISCPLSRLTCTPTIGKENTCSCTEGCFHQTGCGRVDGCHDFSKEGSLALIC